MSQKKQVMSSDAAARLYATSPWAESSFHNPYTFIPFPDDGPPRREPTELTIDEVETDRFTGVLELEVTTATPLMTCSPAPLNPEDEHKIYPALTIGNDVILPATGVRGALRTLLTIIVGGTLGYLDEDLHLCQGRDATLGPKGKSSKEGTPENVFLGRVKGRPSREGGITIELGETRLVETRALEGLSGFNSKLRPTSGVEANKRRFIDNPDRPGRLADRPSEATPWQLKLSGRRVNMKGRQREGVLKPDGRVIHLDNDLYRAYLGRHRHAVRSELKDGDLVWLEPTNPGLDRIEDAGQVRSIQWARWGRRGRKLQELIPRELWPDYLQNDGLVDEVTDLFGQASPAPGSRVTAFAARVRPENLVFFDAADDVRRTTLAPLAPPKPGCLAFYRDHDDPEQISQKDGVRGYKVYRVPAEGDKPWLYEKQPVFNNDDGTASPANQKVNKTADLVPAGTMGHLRIALRGLGDRELALILQACDVPWRLGGGKPLGLGACRVEIKALLNERGERVDLPDWRPKLRDDDAVQQGVGAWTHSQKPVPRMRYPRAVSRNKNKLNRGGHVWFNRHAAPHKQQDKDDNPKPGLEARLLDKRLLPPDARGQALPGQLLPMLDPRDHTADVLYGYDLLPTKETPVKGQGNRIDKIEPFDPQRHATGEERSGGNQSQTRKTRQQQRHQDRAASPTDEMHDGAERPTADAGPTPDNDGDLAKGMLIDATVCEDPNTKKNRTFARHEPTGCVGVIQNSSEMPEQLREIGTTLQLRVHIWDPVKKQPQYRYPADGEENAGDRGKKKSRHRKGEGKRRK